MKNTKILLAAALLLLSSRAVAIDAPHDGSWADSVTDCQSCHQLHGSTGGTLTKFPSNNEACLTCHDGAAVTPNHFFSPAWSSAGREAVPGTTGDQHKWSGSPTARGARIPVSPAMAPYFASGQPLQCAACHDEHGARDAFGSRIQDTYAPNSVHASYRFLDPRPPLIGSGAMELVSLTAASGWALPVFPATYTIRVESFAGSSGTLAVSHDYNKATPPTWATGYPFTVGSTAELDDPNVLVRFTSNPSVGAIWEFYVSYPFLRATNVADAMCTDCHAGRHMGYKCVQGDNTQTDGLGLNCAADGVRTFSHPVNQPLNANGTNLDQAAPVDADGSVADSNPSNDLKLDGTQVRCTTCHAPHNADSNSLTVDVR